MSQTPYHLRRICKDLPEQTGSRKISAAWLAFRMREKRKELLSIVWSMTMAGAIEQYGAPAAEGVERRSQKLLAAMNGIDVSTFNRRLGQFSAPDGRWDGPCKCKTCTSDETALTRRQCHSLKNLAHSRSVGCEPTMDQNSTEGGLDLNNALRNGDVTPPAANVPVPRKLHRQVVRLATFFNKNAGFGQAQLYSLHMQQELKPRIEKKGADKTKNARLLAQALGENWFDAECRGVNNFKSVHGYLWHPGLLDVDKCECQSGQMGLPLDVSKGCGKCKGTGIIVYDRPLPDYARVLITFLLLKGLEHFGSVELTQEQIADALGMDVNTVAKYEDKLEALMIIRCIAGDVYRDCVKHHIRYRQRRNAVTGKYVGHCPTCGSTNDPIGKRDPHKIVWLPDRMGLDEETCQREWQRFQALRDKHDAVTFQRAEALHVALLKDWRGKEHTLTAFWNELRRQFAAAGLNKNVSDVLLPNYRE